MNDCASVCIIENNEKDSKIPFSCCKQETHEKMKKKVVTTKAQRSTEVGVQEKLHVHDDGVSKWGSVGMPPMIQAEINNSKI